MSAQVLKFCLRFTTLSNRNLKSFVSCSKKEGIKAKLIHQLREKPFGAGSLASVTHSKTGRATPSSRFQHGNEGRSDALQHMI
jgi:hypothetical protein